MRVSFTVFFETYSVFKKLYFLKKNLSIFYSYLNCL